MSIEPGQDAEILHLPVQRHTEVAKPEPAEVGTANNDTSYEIALDDEPGTGAVVPVNPVEPKPTYRPIIPDHLNGWESIQATMNRAARRAAYRAGYHAIRSPQYLAVSAWWGCVGLGRTASRQVQWWWVAETSTLRRDAAVRNDPDTWHKLHREARETRRTRGQWLLAEVIGVSGGTVALIEFAPWWAGVIVLIILIPVLVHFGRPVGKPIVTPALVAPRYRVLSADIVLRAYYAAGLGHPDKSDKQITFGSTMSRDVLNTGSQVVVDVPYGVTFSDVIKAREKIASGLDVALSQVYLSRDKTSNRRHMLFVADVDPLSIPAGRTPLLDCKPRDIWRPAPVGVDERGQRVLLHLVFYSMLIGAQPRKGKTFSARALALFAALDPFVRLSVFDGKGSPDWRKFALVAHTYGFGLLPDRVQGDPVENLRATLRVAKQDVMERNARLAEFPSSVCPEGKLTREIARNPAYKMPVWVIILDEFQEYLNTGDEEADREIAELLVFLVKVGPSVGVVLLSSTQRPSGIGSTGKIAKLFTDFRDNHLTRFALKTGSWQVSDLILGAGAYSEGYDSSALPVGDEYRGVGILYDGPVDNCTVRTYLADGEDAEKILLASRKHRERAGTLDGMAAGETIANQARDPLADSMDAFHPNETWVSWAALSSRLAEQMPEKYAQVTKDALSGTLTGMKLGIESKNGRDDSTPSGVAKGVHRAALERALERRNQEEGS